MVRDISICIGLLIAGFIAGHVYADWSRPTREEIANDLGQAILQSVDEVTVEVSENHTGPVVYVALADTPREYIGIARIEIGYEGQYLPSLWDKQDDYYEYHWNQTMPENELLSAIQTIAQERRAQ